MASWCLYFPAGAYGLRFLTMALNPKKVFAELHHPAEDFNATAEFLIQLVGTLCLGVSYHLLSASKRDKLGRRAALKTHALFEATMVAQIYYGWKYLSAAFTKAPSGALAVHTSFLAVSLYGALCS
eukprot:Hpha_TRINITY_DN4449_c0_g1::TRINITY_DN4449_c0_g1_i1::g.50419::m.50419